VVDGKVAREGEQIVLGGNESYVALCRRHWARGELAPMEIRRISAGKATYMPLLLEADPSREMIETYLDAGELYALMVDGQTCAVAVVIEREDGAWEIKNLVVAPVMRGKGYAARLLRHLFKVLPAHCDRLYVGTSAGNVPFYEHFGFVRDGVIEGFFEAHYPEPIIENGCVVKDMIILVKKL
jgi:GNAT superfamily N-acetyltransferase